LRAFRKLGIAILVIAVLCIGGLLALSAWDPPAPSQQVEKDISDELLKD